jgi:hypothetical protein
MSKIATIDFSEDPKISSAVVVSPQVLTGVYIPTIDAGEVYFQAKVGDNWSRVQVSDGSGDYLIASSTGNKVIWVPELAPFEAVRIETEVNQTADREFIFTDKKPPRS